MDSLSLILLLNIFTGIHGKEYCKGFGGMDEIFSCFYGNYHNRRSCMDIIKMTIQSSMKKNFPDECLVKQLKLLCTDGERNNSCNKTGCRKVLSSAIASFHHQRDQRINGKDPQNCDDDTSSNTNDVNRSRNGKEKGKDNGKNKQEKKFKPAIVGISVGITGTLSLILIILVIIFVCRRRPRKKKRKQQANQKSKDQGLEMENLEKNLSSTNKGGYNVLSMNKSINMYEEREENFVLGPCITNYDKDTRNGKLPEITRFNGVEGDEHVYYEIDDDKIKPSTDMEGVHLKRIEVMDNVSFHSDQTTYETQLRSINKEREQLTKQQSIEQRSEIASLKSKPFSTNNKGENTILFAHKSLDTDEAQGEYFVLDPSITKYDKDMSSIVVLPEINRLSVPQGDERVNGEIVKDEIKPQTDMKGVRQKKIEQVMVKCSYHGDQNMYEIPGSTKNTSEQQTRQHSVEQRTEIDLQNSSSGDRVIMSVNESLNTDEEQGEYFVLDPSVTKYDRDISNLVLPEVKRFSVAQCDENVYNEIDEGKFESSTDMQVDHQKQIEDVRDIAIYRTDHINHEPQLRFDNTTYHVASEIDDKSF